jgi:fructose-1-phosphate kinase PfkB-like protein
LGGFFGKNTDEESHVNFQIIEKLCSQWIESGIGPDGHGAVVVRAGKDGCFVARQEFRKWLPAFHQSPEKVVDPTGGGNGFLGGLAMGLVRGGTSSGVHNIEEASIWGSISASFAIEQVGMPVLSHGPNGETWNEVRVEDRLSEFRQRLAKYVQP